MTGLSKIKDYLPDRIVKLLEPIDDRYQIKEVRLRSDKPILVDTDMGEFFVCASGGTFDITKGESVFQNEIKRIMDYVSRFSIYAFAEELKRGYITMTGGNRIGLCGRVVIEDDKIISLRNIASINIRIANAMEGCADSFMDFLYKQEKICNTLIISAPGCGKTTLLRDILRNLSDGFHTHPGVNVGICDERNEIAACSNGIPQNNVGVRTDVLDSCPKASGMLMLLRSMNPTVIGIDEIGDEKDVDAIRYVMNCGCTIVGTVHGENIEEVMNKKQFKESGLIQEFERFIVLKMDKTPGLIEGIYDSEGEKIWA